MLYSHLKEYGGVERIILKQSELLARKGYETTCYFAYIDPKMQHDTQRNIRSYFDLPIVNNQTLKISLSMPLAPFLVRNFKDTKLLMCHGYGPASWIGCNTKLLMGIDYITYIHSVPRFLYLDPDEKKSWKLDRSRNMLSLLARIFEPALRKVDYIGVTSAGMVLANSRYTARRIKELYGIKAQVCYPFVDSDVFKPIEHAHVHMYNEIYAKYNLSAPIVLSTGRIVPVRRFDFLIPMLKYMMREFPSATLVVTGEISRDNAHYVNGLIQEARLLGIQKNIRFVGLVSDMELAKLYNTAHAYVHLCPHEPFGLSPVEAMACGTPAVVWDDGSGPCETMIDGKTGFKAKPYDIRDFAEKVMKTFDINAGTHATFFERMRKDFSYERHLKCLEEVFKNFV